MKPRWFTCQWGNLALSVKIHAGIQPLTHTLMLEGTKYWRSTAWAGKQMRWTTSFFALFHYPDTGLLISGALGLLLVYAWRKTRLEQPNHGILLPCPLASHMLTRKPSLCSRDLQKERPDCFLPTSSHGTPLPNWRHCWVHRELLFQFIPGM